MRHCLPLAATGARTGRISLVVGEPPAGRGLPADISFFTAEEIGREALETAAYRARRDRISAGRALIAAGAISSHAYHGALARQVGVPFVEGWPLLAKGFDPIIALRRGRARLAGHQGTDWLLAPSDRDIAVLLATRSRHVDITRPRLAITTPEHFCAIVRQDGRAAIVHAASEALPEAAPHLSAKGAADASVGLFAVLCVLCSVVGLWVSSRVVVVLYGIIFLASMVSRLLVCAAGLHPPLPPLSIGDGEAPFYTVLVPLYREVAMVAPLVAALGQLDYPRAKLEVLFLVEQNDAATREALFACGLPPGFRVIVVPNGTPRTKPRALNVGLALARGDLVTVYDAEDRPEPDQLRKAAGLFAHVPNRVACLQARLAISNTERLLTRLFAIEYATLFDLFNVGIGRSGLPMALGGTSNHFRTSVLRSVGGWDAYNVTEDADLGLRLARFGYVIESLPSTTWETALGDLSPWLRQRRRWTKGWTQTLIVLGRDHRAMRDLGAWKSFLVGLMLTHLVTGPLLTPFILVIMAGQVCKAGADLHSPVAIVEATLATAVLVMGIASTLWCGAMGLRKRPLAGGWAALPLMLPYQLLISVAAWCGLWDLVRAPYHWHKTEHGLPARQRANRSSP